MTPGNRRIQRRHVFSVGDIAERSGYTPRQIRNLWKDAKLPAVRANWPGKHLYFLRTARIKKWCAKKKERRRPPPRKRKKLPGDREDSSLVHYLTFVNKFKKWDYHVEMGWASVPDIETLRRELEQALRLIVKHCGADWTAEILAAYRAEAERKQSVQPDPFQKQAPPWKMGASPGINRGGN